jgi:hypothetical protein
MMPAHHPLAQVPQAAAEDESAADGLGRGADTRHEDHEHRHAQRQQGRDQRGPAAEHAEGQAGVELEGQTERPPHVHRPVKVVLDDRGGDPVGHQDRESQRERQHPGPGPPARNQRRDSPPLLQATQSLA